MKTACLGDRAAHLAELHSEFETSSAWDDGTRRPALSHASCQIQRCNIDIEYIMHNAPKMIAPDPEGAERSLRHAAQTRPAVSADPRPHQHAVADPGGHRPADDRSPRPRFS